MEDKEQQQQQHGDEDPPPLFDVLSVDLLEKNIFEYLGASHLCGTKEYVEERVRRMEVAGRIQNKEYFHRCDSSVSTTDVTTEEQWEGSVEFGRCVLQHLLHSGIFVDEIDYRSIQYVLRLSSTSRVMRECMLASNPLLRAMVALGPAFAIAERFIFSCWNESPTLTNEISEHYHCLPERVLPCLVHDRLPPVVSIKLWGPCLCHSSSFVSALDVNDGNECTNFLDIEIKKVVQQVHPRFKLTNSGVIYMKKWAEVLMVHSAKCLIEHSHYKDAQEMYDADYSLRIFKDVICVLVPEVVTIVELSDGVTRTTNAIEEHALADCRRALKERGNFKATTSLWSCCKSTDPRASGCNEHMEHHKGYFRPSNDLKPTSGGYSTFSPSHLAHLLSSAIDEPLPDLFLVMISAFVEYMCAEIVELGGYKTFESSESFISVRHLSEGIEGDVEVRSCLRPLGEYGLNRVLYPCETRSVDLVLERNILIDGHDNYQLRRFQSIETIWSYRDVRQVDIDMKQAELAYHAGESGADDSEEQKCPLMIDIFGEDIDLSSLSTSPLPFFNASFDWSNIAVCGGMIATCLMAQCEELRYETKCSDVDLFLHGLDKDSVVKKLDYILDHIDSFLVTKGLEMRILCCGSSMLVYAKGRGMSMTEQRVVQIHCQLYRSPEEILLGFDVDCLCVMFDGKRVYGLPRALRALRDRVNVVDFSRSSIAYREGLLKYARRGFSVRVNGIEKARCNRDFVLRHQELKSLSMSPQLLLLEEEFICHGKVGENVRLLTSVVHERPLLHKLQGLVHVDFFTDHLHDLTNIDSDLVVTKSGSDMMVAGVKEKVFKEFPLKWEDGRRFPFKEGDLSEDVGNKSWMQVCGPLSSAVLFHVKHTAVPSQCAVVLKTEFIQNVVDFMIMI